MSEIARMLRVIPATFYRWAHQGRVEICQIAPHTTRVTKSALAAFLASFDLEMTDCSAGLLLLDEVAGLLRIYKSNVALLEKSGELKLTRLSEDGSTIRITRRSLDSYLRGKGLTIEDVDHGPLMLIAEVAKLFRVDLTTLYRWTQCGISSTAHLSPQNIRISRLFLDHFLREQGSSLAEVEQGLLLVDEYAARNSLERKAVYPLIAAGKVPVIRLSRKALRIPSRAG